jgi:hypothetical protein
MHFDFCEECLRRYEDYSIAEKAKEGGDEAAGSKETERFFAAMNAKQVGKERGAAAEGPQSMRKKRRVPVHAKKKTRHKAREAGYSDMSPLIIGQVAGGDGFACDSIDRPGGVPDKGDVAFCDVPEGPCEGDGSSSGSDGCRVTQASLERGEQRQIVSSGGPCAVDKRDAEF